MSGSSALRAPERFFILTTVSEFRVLLEPLIPMAELGNNGFAGADMLFPAWMVIGSHGPDRDETQVLEIVKFALEAVGMHFQAFRQFGPCNGAELSVQPGEEDKKADCLERAGRRLACSPAFSYLAGKVMDQQADIGTFDVGAFRIPDHALHFL